MKDLLKILGGVICAVTCLIPFINGTGDYNTLEIITWSIGMSTGVGLVLLSNGLDFNEKGWFIFLPLSMLMFCYSIAFWYDNYRDIHDKLHSIHYIRVIIIITVVTLVICVYYQLRRKKQM